MREQTLEVRTPDGAMDTFLALPDAGGPFPPVVLFMDIWGMRDQIRDIARGVAAEGFACAAPDLYYRAGGRHFDRRHPDGRSKSIAILEPDDRQAMIDYSSHLTDDMVVSDADALMAQLRTVDGVGQGPAGCFGYCMGGRHVVRVAAALPDLFRATASFHGTRLVTDGPDSPHLSASAIRGEIYFGYGELDGFTPPEVIATMRDAFADAPAVYSDRVHPGAHHGYAIPDRDVYDAAAGKTDWETVFGMFRRLPDA